MKVISTGVFLLFFQLVNGQYDFAALDQYLQKNQKQLGNNLVALVWKDGKILYQKELGEFNAKTQAPIAASSQWLTAALVMTFVDQGKLDLDEPVNKYLPIFNKYMKSYITLRHCLSHTTGIEREPRLSSKLLDRKKYENLEEEVNAIAAKEISNNPQKEFFYGGYGYAIAARVCEIVAKKSFDRLIQERITRPLRMKGTNFSNESGGAPNPAAGAQSTANDYVNFMSMILNKGMFEGKRILSEAAIAEMHTAQYTDLPVKFAPAAVSGWGSGFGVWLMETDEKGKASLVSSPGFFGCFPYINLTKKYAAILISKSLLSEQKKEISSGFYGIIDETIGQ